MSIIERLRERKVAQWAVAYLAAGWLGLQAFDLVAEQFQLPIWIRQGSTVVLVFGLLITLVLAWNHGQRGRQRAGGLEVFTLTLLVALAGASVVLLRSRSTSVPVALGPASFADWHRDTPPEHSIAVLPCRDLSFEGDQEHFAAGLAEELTTRLAAIRSLRVAARSSAFSFRNSGEDVASIAEALGVRNVLECSVRREGQTVRLAAQLVDARDGFERWSRSYDRDAGSALAVHSEIALAIASALQVELRSEEESRLTKRGTESHEAWDLYLRGLSLHWRAPWTVENQIRGLDYANAAIEADSTFASAWALRASTHIGFGNLHVRTPSEAYDLAEEAALRSLEIDDELAWAHVTLGWTKMSYTSDWMGAEREFRRAIELAPSDFGGYHGLNFSLASQGQFDEAMAAAEEALSLDPLAWWPRLGLFELRYKIGDFAAIIRDVKAQLELEPDDPLSLIQLSLAQAHSGASEEAKASAMRAESLAPGDPFVTLAAANSYAILGDTTAARERLARVKAEANSGNVGIPPEVVATVHASLGDADSAFEWLERGYREFASIVFILHYPEFLPLRADPRFGEILDRLGLPRAAFR